MIIDAEDHIKHYGVPGMRWGKRKSPTSSPPNVTATRQESKAVDRALSPKGHRERNKRFLKNPQNARDISSLTDKLVAQALVEPKSLFEIRSQHNALVVRGEDFAEIVIGRIGPAHLSPFNPSKYVTRQGR